MPRSKAIIITQSILTGLGILFGATLLADIVDPRIVGLGALLVLSIKGGLDFYIAATTTPTARVVATQEQPGAPVVAGPASVVSTGHTISPSLSVADVAAPPIPIEAD
jgi:hypothetical protein